MGCVKINVKALKQTLYTLSATVRIIAARFELLRAPRFWRDGIGL